MKKPKRITLRRMQKAVRAYIAGAPRPTPRQLSTIMAKARDRLEAEHERP